MNVARLMNGRPCSCRSHDSLHHAARLMWDNDCGWLPVIDERARVIGVITDRDICMAALTRGRPLESIAVEGTMCGNVHSCFGDTSLEDAMVLMRTYRVRRLPVVDSEGVLLGLLSLSDLARDASTSDATIRDRQVARTLAAICEPRSATSSV